MKYILTLGVLLIALSAPISAQVVPECSNCTNADWQREWSPSQQVCTYNPMVGCGSGCNCYLGFQVLVTVIADGRTASTIDFFGGAFTPEGFRLDRVGGLARNRVQPGDIVYRLNGRRPTKQLIARYTQKRPVRRAQATWDADGRLHLRLWQ